MLHSLWESYVNITKGKRNRKDFTWAELDALLKYEPLTGKLIWKTNIHSKSVVPNTEAGCVAKSGYRVITLFGLSYPAHHVAWFLHHKVWAEGQLDHQNQQRDDNRLVNLREVTKAENAQNRSRRRETVTGEHGIWFDRRRNKYVAEITMNGKRVYLKRFDNADDAVSERQTKLKELGFHDNHGSISTIK